MDDSEARDWVLDWEEDLHWRAWSVHLYKEEPQRIERVWSYSLWEVRPTYRLSQCCDLHLLDGIAPSQKYAEKLQASKNA